MKRTMYIYSYLNNKNSECLNFTFSEFGLCLYPAFFLTLINSIEILFKYKNTEVLYLKIKIFNIIKGDLTDLRNRVRLRIFN